jgi:hypothetical protein
MKAIFRENLATNSPWNWPSWGKTSRGHITKLLRNKKSFIIVCGIGRNKYRLLDQLHGLCMYVYIGFKTFFYVVRHIDSTDSYLHTGLHVGFFRSLPSLILPSSFFRSSSCSVFFFWHPLQCYVQSKIDTFSLPVRIHYSPYSPIRITVLMTHLADITTNYDAIIPLDCIEKNFHLAYHQFITTVICWNYNHLIHSLIWSQRAVHYTG